MTETPHETRAPLPEGRVWRLLDRRTSKAPHLYRTRRWSFAVVFWLVFGTVVLLGGVLIVGYLLSTAGWGP